MAGLQSGKSRMMIDWAQYINMTDRQTHRQPHRHSNSHPSALHSGGNCYLHFKIWLNFWGSMKMQVMENVSRGYKYMKTQVNFAYLLGKCSEWNVQEMKGFCSNIMYKCSMESTRNFSMFGDVKNNDSLYLLYFTGKILID